MSRPVVPRLQRNILRTQWHGRSETIGEYGRRMERVTEVPEEASGLRQPRFWIRVSLLLDRLPAKANEPCLPQTNKHTQTHTHTHTHNRFMALWILPQQPEWAGTRRNIHPLTPIVVISHPLSVSTISYDHGLLPVQFTCLTVFFPQSLSKFSLVYHLAWHPPLHTPNISSPNHCLLFAAHAHSIATCFAVVPRLCHLILVCLLTLLGTLSFTFITHLSDQSRLFLLKCHLMLFHYRPGLTWC